MPDPSDYPPSRGTRAGPPSGGLSQAVLAGDSLTPPRARVFSFEITANNGTRSVRSSPVLKGPAIITSVTYNKGGAPTGTRGLMIGKANGAVSEQDVPHATAQPWTLLLEPMPGSRGAMLGQDMQQNVTSSTNPLGLIVLDAEWFLVVGVHSSGGADAFVGTVSVVEGVSAESIASFR